MTDAPLDLTRLIERLASQMARQGVRHPVAAAVALACRGRTGLAREAYANAIGLAEERVRACEAGDIPFGDLPSEIVDDQPDLDLLALADFDRELTGGRLGRKPRTGV